MIKKADYIWFNGNMILWKNATIHVMSHSLHYGTSLFEGIRCYNSHKGPVIFRHRDHMQRLHNSAKIYHMPLIYSVDELMAASRKTVLINKLSSCYIRPLVFIGDDVGIGVNPPEGYKTNVIIAAFSSESFIRKNNLNEGIDAIVSSWNKFAPNTIPTIAKASGNYLSSLLISKEARRYGYHEGIALDINGYISETAAGNLFEIKDNMIITPLITSSSLPGITRDTIIKLAKELNFDVKEQFLSRESLYLADEIFMCGTAAEITPIRSIDGIKIGNYSCGPITKLIQKTFFGLFNGITKDKWNWLDLIIS